MANLPKVNAGEPCTYLTPSGWNNAMDAIATAIEEGVSTATATGGYTIAGTVKANESTATVNVGDVEGAHYVINQSWNSYPTNVVVNGESQELTITWGSAPSQDESFTVYVARTITTN